MSRPPSRSCPLSALATGSKRQAGLSLPLVYVAWLAVLLILWPTSSWYAGFKARHRHWWLSYL